MSHTITRLLDTFSVSLGPSINDAMQEGERGVPPSMTRDDTGEGGFKWCMTSCLGKKLRKT